MALIGLEHDIRNEWSRMLKRYHRSPERLSNCPYGKHTEEFIVNALRAANALTVSASRRASGKVVGHIAFSPVPFLMVVEIGMVLALSQCCRNSKEQGIGKSLIHEGTILAEILRSQRMCSCGQP